MGKDVMILGVSGSPRKGATSKAIRICLEAAEQVPGVTTRLIDLANKRIHCCTNCNVCKSKDLSYCALFKDKDDFTDEYMDLYRRCDGIILASPIYLMNPTGLLTNFLGRMRPTGGEHRRLAVDGMRMGGCIAVGGRRNGGQDITTGALTSMLQSSGTSVVGGDVLFYNGATVWSKNEKDFDDPQGEMELKILGRKVAYATKIMGAGLEALKDSLQDANFWGFTSPEEQLDAYEKMGLSFLAK